MKRIFIAVLFFVVLATALANAGTFDRAVAFVLEHEGGYCHDRGWESNYGICSKWYPKEDIKNMTRTRAIEIYLADYWAAAGADLISDTVLAFVYFDCAVLFGPPTARMMLKKSEFDAQKLIELRVLAISKQVKKNPGDVKYIHVWVRRLLDLQLACGITGENYVKKAD